MDVRMRDRVDKVATNLFHERESCEQLALLVQEIVKNPQDIEDEAKVKEIKLIKWWQVAIQISRFSLSEKECVKTFKLVGGFNLTVRFFSRDKKWIVFAPDVRIPPTMGRFPTNSIKHFVRTVCKFYKPTLGGKQGFTCIGNTFTIDSKPTLEHLINLCVWLNDVFDEWLLLMTFSQTQGD